jgi:serine/threonine protein kinase
MRIEAFTYDMALRSVGSVIISQVGLREREERYTTVSVLGRGGMGVVFVAFDSVRQREVALKRLAIDRFKTPAELARATSLFEREYHTLSQLAHPHVISVVDYGIDPQGPF